MRGRRVIIELSPTRLDVAVVRAARFESFRSARLALTSFAERFPEALRACQDTLATMVKELGAEGAPATLVHAGPDAACGVFSCAVGIKPAVAENAARLALSESASFPLDTNPCDFIRLATDARAKGTAAQMHTLGVADTESNAEMLAAWLEAAGLTPDVILPTAAALMFDVVRRAMLEARDSVRVVLHLGEHESVFAAASHGKLRFVRRIAMGTEAFVEAMQREFTPPGGMPIRLDAKSAREFFARHGVPRRGESVDVGSPIAAEVVLPLLQPTIQRFLLETKQSLRFGLTEQERAEASVSVVGPGAGTPNFLKLLAEQASLKASAETAQSAGKLASIPLLAERGTPPMTLLPARLAERRTIGVIRRGVWFGAAAAAVLVLVDAALTRIDLGFVKREVAAARAQAHNQSGLNAFAARAADLRTALNALDTRIFREVGTEPDWQAALLGLAHATPANVHIAELRIATDGGKVRCSLSGRALADVAQSPAESVTRYLRTLSSLPVVRACQLGQTSRAAGAEGDEQRFEMTFELVPSPPRLAGVADVEATP